MSSPAVKELAPNHVCLDQADPRVQEIAHNIPWYRPAHSPHAVPRFYDVSGIIESPTVFKSVIDLFVARYAPHIGKPDGPTRIMGFDARGFLFGPPVALALGIPFGMIRKINKLPGVLVGSGAYVTEYSTDETCIRLGAVKNGDRVILVDDLVATGGTALAGFDLVDACGGKVYEFAAMVALPGLKGVEKIHAYKEGKYKDVPVFTMVDDELIGPSGDANPPEGTPKVIKLEAAAEWKKKLNIE
eukprot:TRINITY_DN3179_c0_g1_i1.p2 TRINITY_DN3179_c0_g1~~TRINITY_DN3179_c0_g1_i1.p2  ORF type:complete len:251 (+),score=52.42 TRINITY_DN3179_c0_g1_i1:22-753(+)